MESKGLKDGEKYRLRSYDDLPKEMAIFVKKLRATFPPAPIILANLQSNDAITSRDMWPRGRDPDAMPSMVDFMPRDGVSLEFNTKASDQSLSPPVGFLSAWKL